VLLKVFTTENLRPKCLRNTGIQKTLLGLFHTETGILAESSRHYSWCVLLTAWARSE